MKKFLIVGACVAILSLGGCAALTAYFANPANDLQVAEATFATTLALYNSICTNNPTIGICTPADMQEAANLEKAITDAIQAAEVVLGAYQTTVNGTGPTSTQVSDAISNVTSAVTAFNNFVNQLQVKKALAASSAAMKAH